MTKPPSRPFLDAHLLNHGFMPVWREGFDRKRATFLETSLAFIRETQIKEWSKREALYGARTGDQMLTDLCKWLDANASFATLSHGFKCSGRALRVAVFKAAHEPNPELESRFAANRLGRGVAGGSSGRRVLPNVLEHSE